MKAITTICILALAATLTACGTQAISDEPSFAGGTAAEGEGEGGAAPGAQDGGGGRHSGGAAEGEGEYYNGPADADEDGLGGVAEGEEPPDDKYEPPGTNPYTMVGYDPLSTFAVDVDTASYDLFRRDVLNGRLPDPASVRLEEYVNSFPYDYPAPAHDSEVPFAIHLEAAPSPLEAGLPVLSVGVQGKVAPPDEARSANLVFLIDVSGSMASAAKLPLVKKVLSETLEILQPTDRVAIVTYASGTGVRLESTPVSEIDTILAAIEGLSAGGSTAGAAGLDLAYQQAEAGFVDGGINHIVLCTDGDFNVGPRNTDDLVQIIEDKRRTGITFTVLGFGSGNLNDAMMEAISNKGNGVYGVIANEDHAIWYVHNRLLSTITFIAKDVKIQVEFNPDHVLAYRLLGYENRAIADVDFRNDIVDAGEIGSGHTVTALYELVLVDGAVPAPEGAPEAEDGDAYDGEREVAAGDLVLVKVRYKEPDATEDDAAFEVNQGLAPGLVKSLLWDAGTDHQWSVAIAAFSEILKGSPFADVSRLPAIAEIVESAAGDDAARGEFSQLFTTARGLLEAQVPAE